MIKVDKGLTEIHGNRLIIRAEFSLLVNFLINKNIVSKEDLEFDFKTGLLSDEELEDEFIKKNKEKNNKEIEKEIKDLLKNLF